MPRDRADAVTLHRVTGSAACWPLLDVAAARRHEAIARAAHAPGALMERVGRAVARLAVGLVPRGQVVAVVCGPGDNGGDGLVAALHLQRAGWSVLLHRIAGHRPPSQDTALALARAQQAGLTPSALPAELPPVDLVIDAVLGLGSMRAPSGEVARAIATMRACPAPVLAVDLPSGLHPDTGQVMGDAAVTASATLCALSLRPGCFTHHGRDHAGTVWLAGLNEAPAAPSAWLTGASAWPARPHASHKGRFGDVIVVGGASGMTGAAALAGEAALAAGAGRVFVAAPDADAGLGLDLRRPELMQRSVAWALEPATLARTTVVAGCGGGEGMAGVLPALLAHTARLVLDADALNAVAMEPALLQALRARCRHGGPALLTPHPLEAARLLGVDSASVQCDRLGAAQTLAGHTGATVLLKGSGSVLAAAGEVPRINGTGNGALASAGTGDVLAGWTAGLWGTTPARTPLEVAAAAAWLHGCAADRFAARLPGRPLRAGALIEEMLRAG